MSGALNLRNSADIVCSKSAEEYNDFIHSFHNCGVVAINQYFYRHQLSVPEHVETIFRGDEFCTAIHTGNVLKNCQIALELALIIHTAWLNSSFNLKLFETGKDFFDVSCGIASGNVVLKKRGWHNLPSAGGLTFNRAKRLQITASDMKKAQGPFILLDESTMKTLEQKLGAFSGVKIGERLDFNIKGLTGVLSAYPVISYQPAYEVTEIVRKEKKDVILQFIEEAEMLFFSEKFTEAARKWEDAAKLKPKDAKLPYLAGVAYNRQGELEKSIEQLSEAQRLDPEFVRPHFSLGIVYFKLSRWNEAIISLKKALQIEPENLEGRYILGLTYFASRKLDQAISEFKALIDERPEDPESLFYLGLCFRDKGMVEQALVYLREAFTIKPALALLQAEIGPIESFGSLNEKQKLTVLKNISKRKIEKSIIEKAIISIIKDIY